MCVMVDLMGVVRNFSEITSSPSAAAALFFFAMPSTPQIQAALKLGMRQECATFSALGDGRTSLVTSYKIAFHIFCSIRHRVLLIFLGFLHEPLPKYQSPKHSEIFQKNSVKVVHQYRVLQPAKIQKNIQ